MVQTLHLRATQDGVIWPRRPLVSRNGLLSCIQNLELSSHDKRPAAFRAVTFNATGEVLAATDERGRVFVFLVTTNRYSFVQHLGAPTIACCFHPTRKTELLVTCEDDTIRCIDVKSQTLVSTLRGHSEPARCACFQKSGNLALTASPDAVILWDTKDWSRYRVLNAGPGVAGAIFVTKEDLVAVCFQDDTIMMWNLESLALKYRFAVPEKEQSPGLQQIAVSDDHKVLVASGRAPAIYVWGFDSQTIIRIIELPPPIKLVLDHAFLPGKDSIISILGDDGGISFLDVAVKTPQVSLEISNRERSMSSFDIECHGRYLAACTSDGFLLLYDLNIARETAARARNESQAEPEEHGSIRVRSGLRDVDTCTLDRSRPVPSKLINSLFGVKHPREAHRLQMQRSRTIEGGPVPLRLGSAKFARPIPLSRPSVQLSAEEIEMNRKRLVGSLKCNGSYPEKYRVLVWRFLLRLPKNEEAFRLLVAKGKHPVFVRLKDQYPLHCDRLFRHFHRILSAMVFWCPAFGELDYLPAIVYPFVKIFRENDLVAFEASLSVMLHWCGDFLVSFPHPPVFAMEAFEKELSRRDAQLLNHLTQFQVTSEVYAWSLLKTIFTEVLSEDEWLCLWDHLLTYSDTPQLLFVAVLAYLSYFRVALLAACDRFSIEHFFHQENAIHMKKFIQLMMIIRDELDLSTFTALKDPHADASSAPSTSPYWPLSRGQYPAFAHYPRGVLDAHVHERNRVALEEAELIQKQQCLNQVKHTSDKLQAEHDKWIKERKRLLRAQERRQNEAIAAEKERLQHLKTLDYETYKQRLEYLNHVKTSAREMLEEAAKWFQVECRRLENTLAMHKERMTLELLSRKHEEDVQRMEAEVHDRVQDIFKHCQIEERLASLRTEFESRAAQQSFEMKATMERWKKEHAEQAREATIQLHQGEDHARRRHEDRLPQTLDQKLSEQQREKKAMIKLDNAQHGRRQEREEWASSHHEVDTHRDAVMVQEERNARVGGLTQERDDNTLPPHYSRESLSQGADSNDVSRRRDNDVTDHDHVSNTVVEKPLQRSNARAGEAIDSNVCDASLLPANVSHKLEPEPRSSENDKRSTSPQSSPQTLQDCSTVEKQDTTRTRQMMHKVSLVHNNVDLITSENVGLARPAKGKGASLSGTAQPNEATSMPRQPLDMWPVQKKDVPSTDRLKPYELKLEDERQSCLTLDFARRSREEPFLAPPARRQESSAEATVSSSCRNAVRRASTRTEYARYLRDDDDDARSPKSDAVLQRPLAELEQKLGVRFDDLSDDDESSEEEDGTLLERAQRLLALSPLDLDSADDL